MNRSYPLNDKFTSVKLPAVYAPRHALIDLFHKKAGKRIIYVSAPAGFGKTLSTQLWLKSSGRIPLWINLDEYDNTPSIFYKLFCTGMLSLQPENKAMSDILASPTFAGSPVEHTIRLLSEFIPDGRQCAVVLDDMHTITNKEIYKSGLLVQKRLPGSILLIILTRNEIAEEYMFITGKEKCAFITARDLAFSTREIQKYFNAHGRSMTLEEASTTYIATNGWAIGVNALAISGQTELDQNGGHILGHYIKTQIWDKWDEAMQVFLLKTSILDEITPELAERLTGEPASQEILKRLCSSNMFVGKTGDNYFRYHHLFLDFLRDILKKQTSIDLNALHREAAQFFYEASKYYIAAEYYIRCGDDNGVSVSIEKNNDYANGLSVEDQFNSIKLFINNVRDLVSGETLPSNLFLVEMVAWYHFINGNARLFFQYADILYANMPVTAADHSALWKIVALLGAVDFRKDLYAYSQMLARRLDGALKQTEDKKVWASSLTQNLPFVHRSMRDFSEFAIDTETRFAYLELAFLPLIGKEYYVLQDCVLAGLYYEKDLLEKAMEYALSAREKCLTDFGIESKFSVQMILLTVSQAMNKQATQVKDIAAMLETENAPYPRQNLLAYETKLKLWSGDKRAAKMWLDSYFVVDPDHLEFYKVFQYFTSARAYMVLGQADKAMDYILRLKKLGMDYRRALDVAEANVLYAVLEWALGNKEEALDTMDNALTAMQEYGFVRVFADEGAAILPILKKMMLNLKKETYHGTLDMHFLNEVTISAYKQSKQYKGIAMYIRAEKPVKLSNRQKEIITLMAKGYQNIEMVEVTGLTIHTIKSHQAAAYAKLDVNNAMDAILRAKELGAIELIE